MANAPYSFREIFEAMTMDLIASLKRNFVRHKKEELKHGFRWEQWQLVKLRELQKYRERNKKIVKGYEKEIEKSIEQILQSSFLAGEKTVQKTILEILTPENTLDLETIKPHTKEEIAELKTVRAIVEKAAELPKVPREESFFSMNDKKLQALQEVVDNDIKKAQHAVLRKMDDVYRQTIYRTEINMAAGAKTLDQAIDMATKDFLEKGINCIEYKDGKRVNVASYAEMALRTASHRATLLGEGKKRSEWGLYTVVVSAHANSCNLCIPWQGKVLIDDVFSKLTKDKIETGYPLLSTAIDEGLLH